MSPKREIARSAICHLQYPNGGKNGIGCMTDGVCERFAHSSQTEAYLGLSCPGVIVACARDLVTQS